MNNDLICPYCDSEDIRSIARSVEVFECNECAAIFDMADMVPSTQKHLNVRRPRKTYYDDDDDE